MLWQAMAQAVALKNWAQFFRADFWLSRLSRDSVVRGLRPLPRQDRTRLPPMNIGVPPSAILTWYTPGFVFAHLPERSVSHGQERFVLLSSKHSETYSRQHKDAAIGRTD